MDLSDWGPERGHMLPNGRGPHLSRAACLAASTRGPCVLPLSACDIPIRSCHAFSAARYRLEPLVELAGIDALFPVVREHFTVDYYELLDLPEKVTGNVSFCD
jgi:hypothetical protein